MTPLHERLARLDPVRALAGLCPACGRDRTTDGRPTLRAERHRWRCRPCGARGDLVDALRLLTGRGDIADLDREAVARGWCGAELPDLPPPAPVAPRGYPPGAAEFWARCVPACRQTRAWLATRGIPAWVADAGLIRSPPVGTLPGWASGWGRGWTALFPLVDSSGEVVSIIARWTDPVPCSAKSRAPTGGYTTVGTIFAGPEHIGRGPTRPVLVVEGEVAWAVAVGLRRDRYVIGVRSGSCRPSRLWSLVEASGQPVTVATDADDAGDRYAERVAALVPRAKRVRPPDGKGWDDWVLS